MLPSTATGTASAAVPRVPAGFATVGAAPAAAADGDTILVAPGTYAENLSWPVTASIKLLSEAGAPGTILDGGAQETGIGI